jgi:IstB-like ATP binding protein
MALMRKANDLLDFSGFCGLLCIPVIVTYTHPHVLVIDEVGYLTYRPDAANVLFHVVNDRHLRERPMIFTTNKPLNEWGKVLHVERPGLGMPVILGVLVGSFLGARVLPAMKTTVLRHVFAIVIAVLAVEMIYHGLAGSL